jgi:hypothetical protein
LRQILVVVEEWPEFRMLGEELHDRETLIVKPLVHVATTLQQHHLDLSFGRTLHKDAADECAQDDADYANNRGE